MKLLWVWEGLGKSYSEFVEREKAVHMIVRKN
jgi:hypothetical protein